MTTGEAGKTYMSDMVDRINLLDLGTGNHVCLNKWVPPVCDKLNVEEPGCVANNIHLYSPLLIILSPTNYHCDTLLHHAHCLILICVVQWSRSSTGYQDLFHFATCTHPYSHHLDIILHPKIQWVESMKNHAIYISTVILKSWVSSGSRGGLQGAMGPPFGTKLLICILCMAIF